MSGKIFFSKSGKFICDDKNVVQSFEPCEENILGEKQYKHLIIPEGIIGFCSCFGADITVTEQFVLPETIRLIGTFDKDDWQKSVINVFGCSKLPTVIIPESVEYIGMCAFVGSNIDVLCLPKRYMEKSKPYSRQFKDAKINKLYVHDYNDGDFYANVHIDACYYEVYYYQDRETGCLPTSFALYKSK